MKINENAFTIVELMVTMVIMSIIIGLVYSSFNTMVSEVKTETKSIEAIMDKVVGLEVIRLDIEHAGFGIATDEPCGYPVRAITANSSPTGCAKTDNASTHSIETLALIIRSTINTANQDTYGWFQVDGCNSTVAYNTKITVDRRYASTGSDVVFLSPDKSFAGDNSLNCPSASGGTFLGYPYDGSIASQCDTQFCNRITYRAKGSIPITMPHCYSDTFTLERAVGGGPGFPVLNCVATWRARFDLDTDGDGAADQLLTQTPYAGAETIANIIAQLKAVHVYALMQDSQFDADYNGDYNSTKLTIDGIDLSVKQDGTNLITGTFNNYRWKPVKITVKPLNLL